jgi:hypothetical protein
LRAGHLWASIRSTRLVNSFLSKQTVSVSHNKEHELTRPPMWSLTQLVSNVMRLDDQGSSISILSGRGGESMSMGQRPRRHGGRTSRSTCRIMGGGGGGFRRLLARFVGYGPGARDLRTIELGILGILAKDEAHIFCSAIL